MNRVKMCLFVFIIFLILVTEKTFGMGIKMNGHYYPLPEDLIKRKVNEMWHEIKDSAEIALRDTLNNINIVHELGNTIMPDSVQITYSTYNNGDVRLNIFITDYIQDLIVKVGDYTCDGQFDIDTVGAHFMVSIREDTLGKYLKISPESFYIPTVDVSLQNSVWYKFVGYFACETSEIILNTLLNVCSWAYLSYLPIYTNELEIDFTIYPTSSIIAGMSGVADVSIR